MSKKYRFKMKKSDIKRIKAVLRGGVSPARVQTRCRVLSLSVEGRSISEIGEILEISRDLVWRTRMRYKESALTFLLQDKARSGRPKQIKEREEQHIVAMACSDPPKGFSQWSVRLLAEEAVRRKKVKHIGKSTVGTILKGHRLKPWREKNVVRTRA